ncbi:MAG TPA: redoxin domain-containing protein [Cyclobacteriaceae bacterium]|nr:redoxin domain-containing protein [Cyclobacteriaceae bacterium]
MKYLALSFLLLACSGNNKSEQVESNSALPVQEQQKAVDETAKGLPDFIMTTLEGELLQTKALQGKNILIFYNPDCDHCQRQAQSIRKQINAFNDWTIYFIAASGDTQSRTFAMTYDLHEQKNVFFATAGIPEVVREMGSIGTPSIFIYDDAGKLVKNFDGETPVEDILKVM